MTADQAMPLAQSDVAEAKVSQMRTNRVIPLATLLTGFFLVSGSDAATCTRAATGECLNLEARDYAFSADSKSLILSYQYRSGGRVLSPVVTANIDLETVVTGEIAGSGIMFDVSFGAARFTRRKANCVREQRVRKRHRFNDRGD